MWKKPLPWLDIIRSLLALGLLVGVGGAATAASFADFGNLNAQDGGIGASTPFDIALVHEGVVVQGDSQDGVAWPIGGADQSVLLPGHELVADIPVFNNTRGLRAEVLLTIEPLDNGSAGLVSDPSSLYRFSASDAESGDVIFGSPNNPDNGLPLSALGSIDFGTLAARGDSALAEGGAWVPGQAGSDRTLRLIIAYPDSVESEQFNGGASRLLVRFKASSTN